MTTQLHTQIIVAGVAANDPTYLLVDQHRAAA